MAYVIRCLCIVYDFFAQWNVDFHDKDMSKYSLPTMRRHDKDRDIIIVQGRKQMIVNHFAIHEAL